MATKKTTEAVGFVIQAPEIRGLEAVIVGVAPIILHGMGPSVRKAMYETVTKRKSAGREAKQPFQEWKECLYWTKKGELAIKAQVIQKAMVRGCDLIEGMKMIKAKRTWIVSGVEDSKFIPLLVANGGKPVMREDVKKLPRGGADLRYRAEVEEWFCRFRIDFLHPNLKASQILNILGYAGVGGIGDERPERSGGVNGRFRVADSKEQKIKGQPALMRKDLDNGFRPEVVSDVGSPAFSFAHMDEAEQEAKQEAKQEVLVVDAKD